MAINRDEITILKARDFSEFDRIFVLFGRSQGKFGAIAKGVRRLTSKKRGHLQTFSLSKISFAEGKGLSLILEAEAYHVIDTKNIPNSEFNRMGFAGMILDKFLPEGVPESEIFQLWKCYIMGDHSVQDTNAFILSCLKKFGFISEEMTDKIGKSGTPDEVFRRLQRTVKSILDTV